MSITDFVKGFLIASFIYDSFKIVCKLIVMQYLAYQQNKQLQMHPIPPTPRDPRLPGDMPINKDGVVH